MTDVFELTRKFNLPKPTTLIQVGASGGQEVELFLHNDVTDTILIEPLDYPFDVLAEKTKTLPNYIPVKALVHSENGVTVDFYVASNAGMSSSVLTPLRHLDIYPAVSFPQKIQLVGYRLDTILDILHFRKTIRTKKYEMLFIDVQGAELFVLKGSPELLQNITYIWTEIGVGDGYVGAAEYIDLIHYLKLFSFQLVYFECTPGGFGDALFVKNRT